MNDWRDSIERAAWRAGGGNVRDRLERAIDELLAAARHGQRSPSRLELLVLGHICVEEGALDALHAIRQYLRERASTCGATTSTAHDDDSGVSRAG